MKVSPVPVAGDDDDERGMIGDTLLLLPGLGHLVEPQLESLSRAIDRPDLLSRKVGLRRVLTV
jgi:hypothetical protein